MDNIQLPNGYTLASRSLWKPAYPNDRPPMPIPARRVFIHHTVTPTTVDPCHDMRVVERALRSNGRLDPGYSFTVHPSGVVLEGAGHKVGKHTMNHNSTSYGIALIGNYQINQPTLAQIIAVSRTINLLRVGGHLVLNGAEDIDPHKDVYPTACPCINVLGRNLDFIRWFTFNPV